MTHDSDEGEYFTLVFKGDLRAFKSNPLKTETPFGVPVAASIGDLVERVAELEDYLADRDSTPWD